MFIGERENGTPIYEQLCRHIRREIESGAMSSGEKLPSRRGLSQTLRISPGTVESAYSQLVAEGYIEARERSGYYVSDISFPYRARGTETPRHARDTETRSVPRYHLSTNAVATEKFPFFTWARLMRECLSQEARTLLSPVHSQGDPGLREEVVRYLRKYRGIEANPANIIIGAGSEFLLSLIVQILGMDRLFAVENPGYGKIRGVIGANGAQTVAIPLDERGISVEELASSSASVAHVTPSHHFPLTTVMPISRRMELLRWASCGSRCIIEDDYDSEFRFSGRPIPALQSLEGGRDCVVYINTFTKSIAPSLRIGYILLPEVLAARYRQSFSFYSCTVSSFEQRTLRRFLAGGHFERHLGRMKNAYRARRDAFVQALRACCGDRVSIVGENNGLHLLVTVEGGMSELELVRSAERNGVRLRGLSSFYAKPGECSLRSTVVLGYSGYGENDLAVAASLLAEAWFGRDFDN